jgi:hypothetical protein
MDEERIKIAIEALGKALQNISPEEKAYLTELKNQIDAAASVEKLDHRLEFCYGIIMNPDKIQTPRLMKAAKAYIEAVRGE